MNMETDYSRIYSKWHSYAPEHVAEMKEHFGRFAGDVLPADRNARILDVGCAMGFALIWLKDLGYVAAEGIDVDAGMVRQCRERQLAATRVEDAAAWLATQPGAFARVFAFDLVEHLPPEQQLELCRAIHAALAPGGRFVCTVPNANSALANRWRYVCWTHRSSFTEHSLDFLLYNAGFRNVEVGGLELMAPPRSIQGPLRTVLQKAFRGIRRLEMATELGWKEARNIPLALNLRGVAEKSP